MPYLDKWPPSVESTGNDRAHIRTSLEIAGFAEFESAFLASRLSPIQIARVLLAALHMPVQ
jgi:hypothetical protein